MAVAQLLRRRARARRRASTSARSASAPTSIRPLPAIPKRSAGPAAVSRATSSGSHAPSSSSRVVCAPAIPPQADPNSPSLSSGERRRVVRGHHLDLAAAAATAPAPRAPAARTWPPAPAASTSLGREEQVVRARLAGHVDAALARRGDERHAAAAGHVDDVQRAAGVLGERDRAPDRLELGDHGPRLEPVARARAARARRSARRSRRARRRAGPAARRSPCPRRA